MNRSKKRGVASLVIGTFQWRSITIAGKGTGHAISREMSATGMEALQRKSSGGRSLRQLHLM